MNKKNLPKAIRPEAMQEAAPTAAATPSPQPGKPAPVMSEALPTRTQMEKRAAALAVFDPGNLAILGGSLPPADLRDLLSLHLRDTESRIALIRDLATRGDLAGIAKEAHVMVSTGGNVGALQTSAYARLLEHACKEGDSAAVPRLVEALRESCTAAARALEDWIAAKPLSGQHKQSA